MASYIQWNEAIAEYFADGLSPGAPFYLSVDEDALVNIGVRYFDAEGSAGVDYVSDFEAAVRDKCVAYGYVQVPSVSYRSQASELPDYMAFLGAMVLAAHRMESDGDAAENNYFTRLRGVLGISQDEPGRPPGLSQYAPEVDLWEALNRWILANGWMYSAEMGPEGPSKYTNYPLSQALLRLGDRGRLEEMFRSEGTTIWDREQVGAWFLRSGSIFPTVHLRELAAEMNAETSMERIDAIVDALYEVYSSIDWRQPYVSTRGRGRAYSSRRLPAGLYREADPVYGIEYLLYPRKLPRLAGTNLRVKKDDRFERIENDSAERYRPLWPVSPDGGETYQVEGDPRVSELVLPKRDFWVLTRDPNDQSSGIFASWGTPRLGDTFLLLCRKEYEEQLNILKDENLLAWDAREELPEGYDGWVEYRECLVLSLNWDVIIPQKQGLYDELRPHAKAAISLKGGLKVNRSNTWIEGYQPEVVIKAFDRSTDFNVHVVDLASMDVLISKDVGADTAYVLPALAPGRFSIEARRLGYSGSADRMQVQIVSWESLEAADRVSPFGAQVGQYKLRGAQVVDTCASGESEG